MPSPRLAFALNNLGPEEWAIFEKFAAEFHAVSYPSLRTMASASGDKGRDGQLYLPGEEPTTVLQYSVAADWRAKVLATLKTLAETMPDVQRLIYATPRVIGPAADDLARVVLRDQGISLDIHDLSWFEAREALHQQNSLASEELVERIANPILAKQRLRPRGPVTLSSDESRIALLHLALEAHDEASGQGLTKASFESLVLAALDGTDGEHRISADEVVRRVSAILPAADVAQVDMHARSALARLSSKNGRVKHHRKLGEYGLSFQEVVEGRDKTAEYLLEEQALCDQLVAVVKTMEIDLTSEDCHAIGEDLLGAIRVALLKRGEAFAASLTTGTVKLFDEDVLSQAVKEVGRSAGNGLTDEQATFAVLEVLTDPVDLAKRHLQRLADSYTLFAFLRQAPDVQKVVLKIFSQGDVWLDTTVVLPLVAETLLSNPVAGQYTSLMKAAVDAGLNLYVTPGVVEEVERHLNRAQVYARGTSTPWHGRVPFVFTAYTFAGRPRDGFPAWVEEFRGLARPEEDVADYLAAEHSIRIKSLEALADDAPIELRSAVQELWNEEHERRRSGADGADPLDQSTRQRLVAHDVENSVGVIQRRRKESPGNALGYMSWWLTLDRTAFRLDRHLREFLGKDAPKSPVLSPDFLLQILRLAPLRTAVDRETRLELTLMTAIGRHDLIPQDLVERAQSIRETFGEQSQRVLQRRVRDQLDEMRMHIGPEALSTTMESQVLDAISEGY